MFWPGFAALNPPTSRVPLSHSSDTPPSHQSRVSLKLLQPQLKGCGLLDAVSSVSHPCSAFSVNAATGSPAAGTHTSPAPVSGSQACTELKQSWESSLSVWSCGGAVRSGSSAEHPQAVIPEGAEPCPHQGSLALPSPQLCHPSCAALAWGPGPAEKEPSRIKGDSFPLGFRWFVLTLVYFISSV